ncbi:MAG: hypothetical protein AABY16_01535 [Nanoarchaeota archaeon]
MHKKGLSGWVWILILILIIGLAIGIYFAFDSADISSLPQPPLPPS